MNRLYLTIFFSCLVSYCFSQSTKKNDLDNMINISIEKTILSKLEMVKERKVLQEYYKSFIFMRDNFPTSFNFNESIAKEYNVSFFDISKYSRKELKKGINVFDLHPIRINKNELLIGISYLRFTKTRKKIGIIRGDGSVICRFCYSCEKQEWELIGIKLPYPRSYDFISVK